MLLTVSVNQRLGEIAALRALGFSRRRVVADVLCESVLIVGFGGLISLPLGAALARGLDGILKTMPGIPGEMHFFVFEPATLGLHAALLARHRAGAPPSTRCRSSPGCPLPRRSATRCCREGAGMSVPA